jgi:hypothetical protein
MRFSMFAEIEVENGNHHASPYEASEMILLFPWVYIELCSKRYGNHATSQWYNGEDNAKLGVSHSGRCKAMVNQKTPISNDKNGCHCLGIGVSIP